MNLSAIRKRYQKKKQGGRKTNERTKWKMKKGKEGVAPQSTPHGKCQRRCHKTANGNVGPNRSYDGAAGIGSGAASDVRLTLQMLLVVPVLPLLLSERFGNWRGLFRPSAWKLVGVDALMQLHHNIHTLRGEKIAGY